MSDLISRQYAIKRFGEDGTWLERQGVTTLSLVEAKQRAVDLLESFPSADRDCTKFMEWLKAEVLDEENWELNAVANGEIICRKFKKMGWLDVEDGYYVDTRPTGEWIEDKYCDRHCICSNCGGSSGTQFDGVQLIPLKTKFCPNCGADMNETRADDDE